jgi:hypothetical protein
MAEKYYQLGTYTAEQWCQLHQELISQEGSNTVPNRCVSCVDDKLHSPTRGTFLLTDQEAQFLKTDPRIKFINIDYSKYPEQFLPPPRELQMVAPPLVNRYAGSVKNYREFENSNTLPATTDATDSNRSGYQLLRCQQKLDPWVEGALADNAVVNSNIQQYGTGKDIDVVVADEGCWLGHPEFQNNCVLSSDGITPVATPSGYVGGNLLPGNGTCDVLDLVLDAPYYIDPEWFDADSDNRLSTRWDGTIVPVENVARAWWSNASQRSTKFAGAGTVSISASYTRLNVSGDNTQQPPTIPPFVDEGSHGTPCGALTYGRTQGWAYNSNKWMLDLYGSYGTGIEQGYDLTKLFHQLKPKNPEYSAKDPTIMSNSYGYRANKDPGGATYYYTHRATINQSYNVEPLFISHMGLTGDNGRWKSEMKTNSFTTALDELIDSGVIFVVASGNSNQKQVKSNHPDYNNYITTTNGGSLETSSFLEFGVEVTGTTNRRGFPQQGGRYIDETGLVRYKTINIGALDDEYVTGLEGKVNYSDRGNDITCYAPADGTLSANKSYTNEGPRPDTYDNLSFNGGVAYDTAFSGTSAACPVVCGLIATVLEHNRDWTWKQVLDWIESLDNQDPTDFYYGVESITPQDANWTDYESLEGGDAKVIYQAKFDQRFFPGPRRLINNIKITNGLNLKSNK